MPPGRWKAVTDLLEAALELPAAERAALLPLPDLHSPVALAPVRQRPIPVESFQHPLSVYNELLEVRA